MRTNITAKEERRQKLAALPFHEKVRIVVKLQEMAAPILRARGINLHPWKTTSTTEPNRHVRSFPRPRDTALRCYACVGALRREEF